MTRKANGYVLESGQEFGPDSIAAHLRHAFSAGDGDVAYSLAQHAAEHIEVLVEACRALVLAMSSGDPIARADAVEFAERVANRATGGPAWCQDDWEGAPYLAADLAAMYVGDEEPEA